MADTHLYNKALENIEALEKKNKELEAKIKYLESIKNEIIKSAKDKKLANQEYQVKIHDLEADINTFKELHDNIEKDLETKLQDMKIKARTLKGADTRSKKKIEGLRDEVAELVKNLDVANKKIEKLIAENEDLAKRAKIYAIEDYYALYVGFGVKQKDVRSSYEKVDLYKEARKLKKERDKAIDKKEKAEKARVERAAKRGEEIDAIQYDPNTAFIVNGKETDEYNKKLDNVIALLKDKRPTQLEKSLVDRTYVEALLKQETDAAAENIKNTKKVFKIAAIPTVLAIFGTIIAFIVTGNVNTDKLNKSQTGNYQTSASEVFTGMKDSYSYISELDEKTKTIYFDAVEFAKAAKESANVVNNATNENVVAATAVVDGDVESLKGIAEKSATIKAQAEKILEEAEKVLAVINATNSLDEAKTAADTANTLRLQLVDLKAEAKKVNGDAGTVAGKINEESNLLLEVADAATAQTKTAATVKQANLIAVDVQKAYDELQTSVEKLEEMIRTRKSWVEVKDQLDDVTEKAITLQYTTDKIKEVEKVNETEEIIKAVNEQNKDGQDLKVSVTKSAMDYGEALITEGKRFINLTDDMKDAVQNDKAWSDAIALNGGKVTSVNSVNYDKLTGKVTILATVLNSKKQEETAYVAFNTTIGLKQIDLNEMLNAIQNGEIKLDKVQANGVVNENGEIELVSTEVQTIINATGTTTVKVTVKGVGYKVDENGNVTNATSTITVTKAGNADQQEYIKEDATEAVAARIRSALADQVEAENE